MASVVWDLDGVLADFTGAFCGRLAARFGGIPYSTGGQQIYVGKSLGVPEFGRVSHPYTTEQIDAIWEEITAFPSFWLHLPPLTTIYEINDMHHLAKTHSFIYLTSRFSEAQLQTSLWLREHGFPEGRVIHAKDKVKALEAESLYPTAIIDDRPKHIEALHKVGQMIVVRDWPYNRLLQDGVEEFVPRVGSVGEFVFRLLDDPTFLS